MAKGVLGRLTAIPLEIRIQSIPPDGHPGYFIPWVPVFFFFAGGFDFKFMFHRAN